MGYICGIRKLGEEDVLSALYHLACNLHGSANCSLPEWHIKYVVKSKRDQRTFDNTKDQSSNITTACYQTSQRVNSVLDYRPYEIHQNSHKHIYNSGNDRHKSGTSEEGKCIRKHDLMEAIMKCRNTKADDDTAEHTHLQGLDAADRSYGTFQNAFCDLAVCCDLVIYYQHTVDGYVHNEVGDQCGKSCYLFLFFCHTDGHTYRKDQRQVIKYRTSDFVHDDQECM